MVKGHPSEEWSDCNDSLNLQKSFRLEENLSTVDSRMLHIANFTAVPHTEYVC